MGWERPWAGGLEAWAPAQTAVHSSMALQAASPSGPQSLHLYNAMGKESLGQN